MPDWNIKPLTSFSSHIQFIPPETITLSNGIKLQVIGDGEDEINKLAVYLPGGSYEEPASLISGITAASLFEGNEWATADEISRELDFCGAAKQFHTHDHYTGLVLSSLNYNFQHTCRILFHCICSPTFPESNVQTITRRVASQYSTMLEEVTGCITASGTHFPEFRPHKASKALPAPTWLASIHGSIIPKIAELSCRGTSPTRNCKYSTTLSVSGSVRKKLMI